MYRKKGPPGGGGKYSDPALNAVSCCRY